MSFSIRSAMALALVTVAGASFAQGILRTQDPALSPDGQTIVFSWQGDLWSVPAAGGHATRLTVHGADETFPVWAPDGKSITFASNRFGNLDLFRMAPDGSGLTRLSWESSDEYPTAISADGSVVYGYTNAFGRLNVFSLRAGGDLVPHTTHFLEMFYNPSPGPEGKVYMAGGGSAGHWRKPGHNGANTSEIWVADGSAPFRNFKKLTTNEAVDNFPVYSTGRIFFVSNRSGAPNVWAMNADGSQPRMLTNFSDGTIRFLSVSADGKTAAFQKDSAIWTLKTESRTAAPLNITAPADSRRDPYVTKTITTGFSGWSVSPNGKWGVVVAGGDLFLTTERGGATRRLTTNVRPDTRPTWLDDDRILYNEVTDQGRRRLNVVTRDGQISTWYEEAGEDLTGHSLSPDGKTVVFVRGLRYLCARPVEGGETKVLSEGNYLEGVFGGQPYTWSPDGQYLAVSLTRQRGVELQLVPLKGGSPVVVGAIGKDAGTPVFSADGKYLVFSAVEGNNYSEIRNGTTTLEAFRLVPEPVTFDEDALEGEAARTENAPVQVKVEPNGLRQRRRVLLPEGAQGYTPHPTANFVWGNVDGQFSAINIERGGATPVAGITGPASVAFVTKTKAYVSQGGRLLAINLANGAVSPISVSCEQRVDQAAEEQALFEEIWWTMARGYYDRNFHGKDWDGIRREFEPRVKHATSRADFYALMGEMMERLDSSHLGATAPRDPAAPTGERTNTAWLGVSFEPAGLVARRYIVDSVMPGSPASHPDMELMKGDRIVSVNGTALGGDMTLAQLLDGRTGRKVMLKVERGGRTVDVAIKPASRALMNGLAYDAWVQWSKREVDRLSNGRLGYIHIEGMDEPSLATFLTEIQTDLNGKEGLVVDVRFNGGGYTSHIILNIMRKEPWLIRTNPDSPLRFSENNYRGNALEMPAVAMTNQYSFSNAEIFSEGFQAMKLGPVVGERTGGGVIGTYSMSMWDGGSIRMPASGAYTVDMENLERNGRRPTVEVLYDPNLWLQGRDAQLERAVQELLKRLN